MTVEFTDFLFDVSDLGRPCDGILMTVSAIWAKSEGQSPRQPVLHLGRGENAYRKTFRQRQKILVAGYKCIRSTGERQF